jgi:hypothetical protein
LREFLTEIVLLFGGVILSRFFFASVYKSESRLVKPLSWLIGISLAASSYWMWATTGFDGAQHVVCMVYPAAPACEKLNKIPREAAQPEILSDVRPPGSQVGLQMSALSEPWSSLEGTLPYRGAAALIAEQKILDGVTAATKIERETSRDGVLESLASKAVDSGNLIGAAIATHAISTGGVYVISKVICKSITIGERNFAKAYFTIIAAKGGDSVARIFALAIAAKDSIELKEVCSGYL